MKHEKKRFVIGKKITSIVLVLIMMVALLPNFTGNSSVYAEPSDSGNTNEISRTEVPTKGSSTPAYTMTSLPTNSDPNKTGWGRPAGTLMNGMTIEKPRNDFTVIHLGTKDNPGNVVYCIQPGTHLNSNGDFTIDDEGSFWESVYSNVNNTIDGLTVKQLLGYVMNCGYRGKANKNWTSTNSTHRQEMAQVIATQLLIWEVVVGERDAQFNHMTVPSGKMAVLDMILDNNPIRSEIMESYNNIVQGVRQSIVIPSFMFQDASEATYYDFTQNGNVWTLTLTDTNNVLNDFTFRCSNSNISISKSGNRLTVTSTTRPTSVTTIIATKTTTTNEIVAWYNGHGNGAGYTGYQNLMVVGNEVEAYVPAYMLFNSAATNYGSIVGHKVLTSTSVGLSGAVIGLFDSNTTTFTTATALQTTTSGDNGIFIFNNVSYGNYIVREIAPPTGYILSTESYPVTVSSSTSTVSITIENSPALGSIAGIKTDASTGDWINGAVFGLFNSGETVFNYSTAIRTAMSGYYEDGRPCTTGMFYFRNIPYGDYLVRELEAPIGYQLDTTVYDVTVSAEEFSVSLGLIRNYPATTRSIIGTKVNPDGFGLFGAEIALYRGTLTTYGNTEPIATYITNDEGVYQFRDLAFGTYVIKEITAPHGYQLSSTVYQVTLSASSPMVVNIDEMNGMGPIVNYPTHNIKGLKYGGGDTGNTLAGAVFGLFANSTTTYTVGTAIMTATSDAQGEFIFENVSSGTYKVKELVAPDGYDLNNTVYTVTVTNNGVTYPSGALMLMVNNTPTVTNSFIVGRKVDENGDGLEGATIGLFANSSSLRPIKTATTRSNGSFRFNDVPYGSYVVKEIAAPEGYVLNGTSYPVTLDAGGQSIEIEIVNTLIKGSVSGKKVDENGTGLAGARIGLFAESTTVFTTANAITTTLSGRGGAFSFTDIPYGNYIVHEIAAPSGYILSSESYPVNINSNGQTISIQIVNVLEINSGVITGTKKDNNGNNLSGATIGLFSSQGSKDGKSGKDAALQTAITDTNGSFTFNDVPYGTYIVREIAAPEGYVLNDTAYTVTLNSSGQSIEIIITNTPIVGSVSGRKVDDQGKGLAGAFIAIYRASDTTTPLDFAITDNNGRFTFTNLAYGEYVVQEFRSPPGYILDSGLYPVTISENEQVVMLVIVNTRLYGSVSGMKVDGNGNGLGGARIGLYGENDLNNPIQVAVSNNDGSFSFTEIPYGNYVIKEISSPTGYILTEETFDVSITEDGQVIPVEIVNTAITGSVSGKKVDENGKGLGGATIALYKDSTTGKPVKTTKTASNGSFSFTDIPYGDYIIKEAAAPSGYILTDEEFPVSITSNGQVVTIQIVNKGITGSVSGMKVDDSGNALGGATIGLYKSGNTTTPIATTTSAANGSFSFTNIAYGSYIVKEIAAPTGYVLTDKEFPVTINSNGQVITIEITNKLITGSVSGMKVDENGKGLAGALVGLYNKTGTRPIATTTSAQDGSFSFTNLAYGDYRIREISAPAGYMLNSTYYPVTISEDEQVVIITVTNTPTLGITGIKYGNGDQANGVGGAVIGLFKESTTIFNYDEAIATAKTEDSTGYFEFTEVDYGTYLVCEIEAPEGYVLDQTPYKVVVSKSGVEYPDGGTMLMIDNKALTGGISGMKIDENGAALAGATIGLFYSNDLITPFETTTSGANGAFSFKNVPYGNYVVKEIKAPEGYVLTDESFPVTINKADVIIEVTIKNTIMKGSVSGTKVDDDNNGLGGALIGLFNDGQTVFTIDTAINTTTSAANGSFSFTNIPYGKYIVREIAAPNSYVLNTTSYPVVIDSDGCVIVIKIDNTMIHGSIQGIKKDEDGNVLAGATIGLFAGDETELTEANAIATTVSDANGAFSFTDLPYGNYKLKELAAPEGYVLSNTVYTAAITTQGQVVEIEIINTLVTGSISGKKVDDDGNGLGGALIGLFKRGTTSFTAENAEMTTVSAANGSFSFENVPYGRYLVREIEAPTGYILDSTAYAADITVDGQTITIEIENTLIKGSVAGMKVDEDGNALGGALIGLYAENDTATPIATTTSAANGSFSFTNIAYGRYVVKEISSPTGYILSSESYPVVISENEQVIEIEITNSFVVGSISGMKINGSGDGLAGATIGLFPENTTEFTVANAITTTVSASNGAFGFTDIVYGNYIVKEIASPEGYVIDSTAYPVAITTNGQVIEVEIVNNPIIGSVSGIKVDENNNALGGALIGIFKESSPESPLTTTTSAANGSFSFTNLAYGRYIVKEITAPTGYILDSTAYPVEINTNGQTVEITIKNTLIRGSVSGMKVDDNGNALGGATIGLYKADNLTTAVATTTSAANGSFSFSNIAYGSYVVKEIAAPTGYILDATAYPVEIDTNGQTVEITIENTLIRGSVSGMKVDDNGNALGGATIGLYKADNLANAVATTTSAANGSFSFSNIAYGSYVVKEIAAPTGYILDSTAYPVVINTDGQTVEITIENTLIRGSVSGMKVDENNQGLAGATIGLFRGNETTFTEANAIATTVSAANGVFSFTNLPYGTYKVKELKAPEGYILSGTVHTVTITTQGQVIEVKITNTGITGSISGKKVDDDGNGLSGATIGLFTSDETEFVVANAIQTTTSGTNGTFSFANVPYGEYVVREITAPEGYILDTTVYPATVDTDGKVIEITIKNTIIKGSVNGKKVDDEGNGLGDAVIGLFEKNETSFTIVTAITTTVSATDGSFSFTDIPYGEYVVHEISSPEGYVLDTASYPVNITSNGQVVNVEIKNTLIRGTIQGLKKDGDGNVLAGATIGLFAGNETELTEANAIATTVSAANGTFSFTDLPYGKYKLKELAAPEGYVLSNAVYTAAITTQGQVVEIEIINAGVTGSISGQKVDDDDNGLSGALIGLFNSGITNFTSETAIMTTISAANGNFSFENVPYGNYIVREISSPEGYVLNETSYPVSISTNGQNVTVNIKNTLIKGSISGKKVDDNGNGLGGALIGIYREDDMSNAIATTTSAANGSFSFSNLAYGRYVVKEISSPAGYIMSTTEYPVVISTNGQNVTIEIKNTLIRGSVNGKKVDDDGNSLAGATIGLFNKDVTEFIAANAIQATVSASNGSFGFNNVPYGEYVIHEVSAPTGYILDSTSYPVNIISNGQVVNIEIVNTLIRGTIQGLKKDGDGNVLAGATIGLFAGNETELTAANAIATTVSAANGTFSFTNLPYGNYKLKELAAPEGYVLSNAVYTAAITTQGQVVEIEIINAGITGSINGTKVDDDGNGLGGATIGLFDKGTTTFTAATAKMTTISAANGSFSFTNVPYGAYIVREIAAPEGYVLDATSYEANIATEGQVITIEIENTLIKGSVSGIKVDDNGNALGGATIGLYNADNTTNPIATTTSASNGSFSFSNIAYGSYIVKEVAAPTGYVLDSTVYPVEITTNNQVINIKIENTLIKGSVSGIKVDENGNGLGDALIGLYNKSDTTNAIKTTTSASNGSFSFTDIPYGEYVVKEISAPEGYVLDSTAYPVNIQTNTQVINIRIENTLIRGSIQGVKKDGDGNVLAGATIGLFAGDETDLVAANAIATTISASNGAFSFTNLPYGSYKLKELVAPEGYVLSNAVYTAAITTQGQVVEVEIINAGITGSINGTKVDDDDNGLSGAVIGLFNKGETTFTAETARMTTISAANGSFSFTNVPYGEYIVREIAAPEGYVLDATSYEANIATEGQTITLKIKNILIRGSIAGMKVDDNGNGLGGALIGLYHTGSSTPIETTTSASNGIFTFTNLVYGSYVVKEITAPVGYALNNTAYPVTVNTNGVVVEVEIENQIILSSISGVKNDERGNGLGGAKIGLFTASETTFTEATAIQTAISASDGSFRFDGITYGDYVVREIEAPAGYILNTTAYPVSVGDGGQSVDIVIVNQASRHWIDVTKRIKASDINWANGNPTFLFILSTTESSRNNNKYNAIITFDRDYVLANTDEDGYVEKTVRFDNLFADQYVLTEGETLRYEFVDIRDVVNGAAFYGNSSHPVYGNCVAFDLDKSEYGEATFTNVKTNWSDASHTDNVINFITVHN